MITQRALLERLLYSLLVMLFLINIVALLYLLNLGNHINNRTNAARQNTAETRAYALCLAKFFTEENRQQKSIRSLEDCTVEEVK